MVMAGVSSRSPTVMSSKYIAWSAVAVMRGAPPARRCSRAALHDEVGLALLHHLVALIQDRALQGDQAVVGLVTVALGHHPGPDANGVSNLDGPLELPAEG